MRSLGFLSFSCDEALSSNGQIEINQILQYVAPSFNANKQSGSDGADHIDPATLRGLGPGQMLVLINGKRRHSSSLANVFGARGRGNTGAGLNAIPANAIERIEILRDGASAQYGSDAIAGVINIVLKDEVGKLTANASMGAYNTNAEGTFPAGAPNTGGRNYRETDAFAFTRNNPTARNVVSIYPNGFTPRITSVIFVIFAGEAGSYGTFGANNLLNAYPSIQEDGETETGGYWDAVQMGFSGAFYFARLGFKF